MLRLQASLRVVEVHQIARADIDRSDGDANVAVVDTVEIGVLEERRTQRGRIVKAHLGGRFLYNAGDVCGKARCEKALLAFSQSASGSPHARPFSGHFWKSEGCRHQSTDVPKQVRWLTDSAPEAAQCFYAVLGCIAGDYGGVQGANRDARNPGGFDTHFSEPLVDAGLIGTQCAAALQDQTDLV